MSFLDERDDRPARSSPRRPPPTGPGSDRQTLVVRRIVAIVIGALLVILAIFLIRGCLDSREQRSYEEYVQEVSSLLAESDQQSDGLFQLLEGSGGQSEVDVQNNVNGFRVAAEQLVDRARDTERPDDLDAAQESLVEALQFRSDGVSGIASRLPTALADEGSGDAVDQIAAQMQNFLTSDVIYSQRVIPNLEGALRRQDLRGQVGDIPESRFLPDIDWLQPAIVAARVGGTSGNSSQETGAPGLHGTGLDEVTVEPAGEALIEGATTEIPLADEVSFEVTIANQGENEESDVPVGITIGSGRDAIELAGDVDSVAEGETGTATIPLTETPPSGEELELTVTIEPVAGEEMLDNNEGTFTVSFTS